MAKSYANLDPTALGPTLELTQGNLVVQSNRDGTDWHRLVRGTMGVSSGVHAFEVGFWGDGELEDHAVVGIVTGAHKLSMSVGEGANGYGWRLGNDGVYQNDTLVLALDPTEKKRWIGVRVDLDASSPTVTFLVDGTPRGTVEIDDGKTWFPAITVSGEVAYDLSAFLNTGQRAAGFNIKNFGWYSEPDPPSPLYLCAAENAGYTSRYADTPSRTTFRPSIVNGLSVAITCKCGVWMWSASGQGGSSFSSIDLRNDEGTYDYLIGRDLRNTPVYFRMVRKGNAYSTATQVGKAIIDRVDSVGESLLRFTLKGCLTKFEEPAQQRLFPPWAEEGVANRPMPITLGGCRNVEGILEDSVALRYIFGDSQISNFAIVRDMGAPLDPYALPNPQYTPTNDARGLILETNPVGVLTADVDNVGEQFLIPGANDVLLGSGAFTDWPLAAPNPPDGWDWTPAAGNTLFKQGVASGFEQNYVATIETNKSWSPDNGAVGASMPSDSPVLLPGRTYRVQFELARTTGSVPSPVIGATQFGFMMRSDLTNNPNGAISPHNQPIQAAQWGVIGTVYTFTYTCPPGAARKLYPIVCATQNTNPALGFGTGLATFYNIKLELLGQIQQIRPLEMMKLADYMAEILEVRGNGTEDDWVREDAETIDSDTGYPGIGVCIREPFTTRRALEEPMPSYCADIFEDREGKIRVRRLTDPTEASESEIEYEFDDSNMKFNIQQTLDVAPNLTTSAGVRRNWRVFSDADFVTDELVMPAALKTQFKRPSQIILSSSVSLADTYRAALNRQPIHFLFDDPQIGQAEIDRVNNFYRANRYADRALTGNAVVGRFLTIVAEFDEVPPELYFNSKVRVRKNRFGLDAGKVFCVTGYEYRPLARLLILDVWSPG